MDAYSFRINGFEFCIELGAVSWKEISATGFEVVYKIIKVKRLR